MIDLLDFKEAAAFLRVEPSTIRAWTSQRRLPVIRLGRAVRYLKSDLELFVSVNRDGEIRKEGEQCLR